MTDTDQIAKIIMLISVLVSGFFVYKLWKSDK